MEANDSSDSLTEAAMTLVHEHLETILYNLAGKPVGFALVVSDGNEVATTTNLPMGLTYELLLKSCAGVKRRLRGESGV